MRIFLLRSLGEGKALPGSSCKVIQRKHLITAAGPLCIPVWDFDLRIAMVRGSEQAVPLQAQTLTGSVTVVILSPLLLSYPMGKLCSRKCCWLKAAHSFPAYTILRCTGQNICSLLPSSGQDVTTTLQQRTSYLPSLPVVQAQSKSQFSCLIAK